MELLKHKALYLVLLLPFLFAIKNCERTVTWGKSKAPEWVSMHATIDKNTSCSDCHSDNRTRKTKPDFHNVSWKHQHGKFVQKESGFNTENLCYVCHNTSDCSQCHLIEKPKNHTNFWRLRGHGVSMGLDRNKCAKCHQTNFCERCHSQTKPRSHTPTWGLPQLDHCTSGCHRPVSTTASSVTQSCEVCHKSNPSHP